VIRATGWTFAAIAAAISVVLAVPIGAGLAGVAQIVAFRSWIAVVSLAAAAVVTLVMLIAPRSSRAAFVPLAVVLTAGAVAQCAVLGARSLGDAAPAEKGDKPVTILSFNTFGAVPGSVLAELVEKHHVDVATLPQTSIDVAQEAATLVTQAGRPMQALDATSEDTPHADVVMLVARDLGDYPTPTLIPMGHGGLLATSTTGGPTLAAVHPLSPRGRPDMATWRRETREATDLCAQTPGAIVAGDFNATLDHPGLRDLGPCVDVAREVGRAASGTWPASLPSWLAAPIDHVLVDGRAWRAVSFDVLPATGGSDHRPILATVAARQ